MKRLPIKISVLFFGLLIVPIVSEALTIPRTTLGTVAYAADAFTFFCPTGTTRAQFRVTDDINPTNTAVSIVASLSKDGSPTLTAIDNDNTTAPSALVTNADGAGAYYVMVRKFASTSTAASVMEDYKLELFCLNSLNQVIGPSTYTTVHNQ